MQKVKTQKKGEIPITPSVADNFNDYSISWSCYNNYYGCSSNTKGNKNVERCFSRTIVQDA